MPITTTSNSCNIEKMYNYSRMWEQSTTDNEIKENNLGRIRQILFNIDDNHQRNEVNEGKTIKDSIFLRKLISSIMVKF